MTCNSDLSTAFFLLLYPWIYIIKDLTITEFLAGQLSSDNLILHQILMCDALFSFLLHQLSSDSLILHQILMCGGTIFISITEVTDLMQPLCNSLHRKRNGLFYVTVWLRDLWPSEICLLQLSAIYVLEIWTEPWRYGHTAWSLTLEERLI